MELAKAEGNAQWPMSDYDKGNTNSCPYDAAGNDGDLLWSYHTIDSRMSRPVIGEDGTLYIHTTNRLLAISSDGEELWEYSGEPSHQNEYSEAPVPAAIGNDGCIYYATGSPNSFYLSPQGGLYAVWPNGTLRWADQLSAPVMTAPRIDDQGDVLIVASQWMDADSLGFLALRCYNEGGDIKWTFSPPSANGSVFSEPAISSNGTVYLLTYLMFGDSTLWAIDPSGNELWNKSVPASNIELRNGAFSSLRVSIDRDGSLYLTVGSTLRALDPNGQERWNYSEIDGYNRMAIGEDHLFVVDGAYMHILNKDGEWIATYFAGKDRYIYPMPTVLPGDNVILTPWFGGVQIVNATGVRVWNYPIYDASADSVVVDDQGRIYIVVGDGASSPSMMAIGERNLQTDVLAWDVAWILSIVFGTGMLLLYMWTRNRRAKDEEEGVDARVGPNENRKVALIIRVLGALMMLSAVLIGSWAIYGSDFVNHGLFAVMNTIPLATLLVVGYITLILASAVNPKWGIGQYVMLVLITIAMLLSDPLQTVQGGTNDGWVPQLGFVIAWLGTGLVLLSGLYHDPEM